MRALLSPPSRCKRDALLNELIPHDVLPPSFHGERLSARTYRPYAASRRPDSREPGWLVVCTEGFEPTTF